MELCDSLGNTIAQMVINFKLLKVWRGQKETLIADIKNRKQTKIG